MQKIDRKFWLGKRVLLTGHTGFKGTWISILLKSLGVNLSGISLHPDTKPSLFEMTNLNEDVDHNISDIRNFSKLNYYFENINPEIVIHMAAQPLVRKSYENPLETYEINVMGTANVLQAARMSENVKSVIVVTTDKCYENKEWDWGYREIDTLGGHDPYSNSKACSELVCSAFRSSFMEKENISLATVRAGNVIGGGDWSIDRLVPDILFALEKNEQIKIRNPNSIRPWQHVIEPIYGYLLLAEKLYKNGEEFSGAWNFGPNYSEAKNVKWIAENLIKLWGKENSWNTQKGEHPHEANFLKLDISKTKTKLNWQPKWSTKEALGEIISWHKSYLEGENLREKCIAQIRKYEMTI